MPSLKHWRCISVVYYIPSCRAPPGQKAHGKYWFEQEIAYQVYADGSFLQFSMNYHRVVVQLAHLGFAIGAAERRAVEWDSIGAKPAIPDLLTRLHERQQRLAA